MKIATHLFFSPILNENSTNARKHYLFDDFRPLRNRDKKLHG